MAEVVSPRGARPRAAEGAADDSSTRSPHLKSLREITNLVNAGRDIGAVFGRIVLAVYHHTSWTRSGIMADELEYLCHSIQGRVGCKSPSTG
jgi:hypothetical protein